MAFARAVVAPERVVGDVSAPPEHAVVGVGVGIGATAAGSVFWNIRRSQHIRTHKPQKLMV